MDRVISNVPDRITYTNLLPCSNVSEDDAPYVYINVLVKLFQPRCKMIRNEREFDEQKFLQDFSELPFNLIYSTDDIDDKLDLINSFRVSKQDAKFTLKVCGMVELCIPNNDMFFFFRFWQFWREIDVTRWTEKFKL